MPVSVTMPRLGESVTEGTVTRWLKQEGDQVTADEPLLEVSTDKVDTEVPSPASGVLTSIKVAEDETVEIGVELAVISEAGESAAEAPAAGGQEQAPAPEPEANQPQASEPPAAESPASQPAAEPQAPAAAAPVVPPAPGPSAPAPSAPSSAPAAASAPAAPGPSAPAPSAPAPAAPAPATSAPAAPAAPAPAADDDEVAGTYVTPLVRKLASEHGIDLNTLTGTGVGGRIRKSDVLNAANAAAEAQAEAAAVAPAAAAPAPSAAAPAPVAAAPAQAPGAAATQAAQQRGQTVKLSRLRQVIAARMVESLQVSAQLTTVVEVDVTRIARLRAQAKADFERREGVKLSFLPFFAIAAVEALKEHPNLNCSVDTDAGTVTYHEAEHLGIAVDTERGLLVPVIHNAGDLNLGGIARKIADLAERTRTNKVSPDELGGGTFTLTNTGSRGALFDTPIINQPQVGILGTGAVVKRPVVIDDSNLGETIAVRSMVYLALSYDHRIVDGADAARFLGTMKARLEAGAFERALGL
ncbi:MAG TPA: 2-oxoglutarate dehydrogenase, E2 component, dihydrolipoamide succinyltransferase [Jatrophihabitans sp.]|nr:2-oxoglutarate dehydrogenase, E2 component, dihydrolipoamide succinyltransferase [Jatrophihabitans sp.]